MWTSQVEETFAAAHANGPEGHKCNVLHGHDWKAIVQISYDRLDEVGWGPDFGVIKGIIRRLDHQNLNDYFSADLVDVGEGMRPSAENIAKWLFGEVRQLLRRSQYKGAFVDFVTVHEGDGNRVTYRE